MIFEFIKKNELFKNILIVFSGNAVSQLIPFLGSVVIARLYSPDDLGEFAFILVVVNSIVLISDFKLSERIIVVNSTNEKTKIFDQSILLIIIMSLVSIPLSYILFYDILGFFSIIIPFLILILSLSNLLINYSISVKRFKENSIYKILLNLNDFIFQVLLHKFKIFGLLISRLFGAIISYSYLYKSLGLKIKNIKFEFDVLKQNKNYVINYVPNVFVNHFSTNSLNIIFPYTYGLFQLGLYAFVVRILFGPVSIITSALQQVFFKEISDLENRRGDIRKFFTNFYIKVISIIIIPVSLIAFFSKEIITFLFGQEWSEASIYIISFAPFFILNSCNSSFSSIFVIKNEINKMLKLELIFFVLKLALIISCYLLGYEVDFMVIVFGGLLFITSLITAIFFYKLSLK